MRTLLIYSAMCNELPHAIQELVDYTINNGFLDYSKDYSISTYIADVAPSRTRLSGQKYEGHTATIQFLFQAGLTPDSVIETRSIIEDVETYLAELQNKQITTTNEYEILPTGKIHRVKTEEDRQVANANGIILAVSKTKLITATINVGKTENGRELFSLNAAIAYYIIGNNIVTPPPTPSTGDDDEDNNDDTATNKANTEESADNSEEELITQEEN